MKTKTTLILLVMAIVLGLFIFLIEKKIPTTEESERLGKRLFRVEPKEISRIELKRANEEIVCQRKSEGNEWEMTKPLQARADIPAIEQVLRELELGEKKGTVKPESDLAVFGLVTPTLTVSFAVGEENIIHRVRIGNKTQLGEAYYIILDEKDEVYLVDKSFYDALNKSVFDLRDKKVISLPISEINRCQFVRLNQLIELTRLDVDKWGITKPISDKASPNKIRDILSKIEDLSAESFVAEHETDLAKYGLAQPRLELTFFTPKGEQTILWGNPLSDDSDKVYATKKGTNTVISLGSSSFNEFDVALKDLRDKKIFDLSLDKITQLELKYPAKPGVQIRKQGSRWEMITPAGTDFDASSVPEIVTKFNDTMIEEFIADSPTDLAPYGLVSPTIETLFTFSADDPQLTVSLAPSTATPHTYLKRGDSARIVAVEHYLFDTLKKGSLIFRRKSLLNIPRHKVTQLAIEKEGVKTVFKQEKPGHWHIIAPKESELKDESKLYDTLDIICYLGAIDFIEENPSDLVPYGLDKPTYRVDIEYQEDTGPKQIVLLIGNLTEKGDFHGHYAMLEGQPTAKGLPAKALAQAGGSPIVFVLTASLVEKLKEIIQGKSD